MELLVVRLFYTVLEYFVPNMYFSNFSKNKKDLYVSDEDEMQCLQLHLIL